MKHVYPIIPDIGLKVHKTFLTSFEAWGREFVFHVRSKSEANIAKSCFTYYKAMWDGTIFPSAIGIHDVVVDVGAHVGFFSVPVATIVRRVIAYEPSPANFELLEKNVKENIADHVEAIQCAVGANVEKVILNLGVQGTTGHSITNKKRGGVKVEVGCVDLQWIVARYNPTVLKLDCEGAEWNILTKPDPLMGIRIIVAELHKVKQHDLPKMVKVLKQAKFKVEVKHNSWFSKLIAFKE